MALPISREQTFASDDAIDFAVMNAIQDAIIAAAIGTQKRILPMAATITIAGSPAISVDNISDALGAFTVQMPFTFDVGNRVSEVLVFVVTNTGAGAQSVSVELFRQPRAGGAAVSVAVNTSVVVGELILAAVDHTILEDNVYFLEVVAAGGFVVSLSYSEASWSVVAP